MRLRSVIQEGQDMKNIIKSTALVLVTLFHIPFIYCSQSATAVKSRTVVAQSSNKKVFKLDPYLATQSLWVINELSADSTIGTQDAPLQMPLTKKQHKMIVRLLNKFASRDDLDFTLGYLVPLELDGLAEVISICHALQIEQLLEIAIKEFVRFLCKEKNLVEFAVNSGFLERFNFSDGVVQRLRGEYFLKPKDLSELRSHLYRDLPVMHEEMSDLSLSPCNRFLLVNGKNGPEESFVDIWDLSSAERRLSLFREKPLRKSFWCAGLEIGLQSDSAVRLMSVFSEESMLSSDSKPFIQPKDQSKLWGACLSPDFSLFAAGVGDTIILKKRHSNASSVLKDEGSNIGLSDGAVLTFSSDSSALIEIRSNGVIRFWKVDVPNYVQVQNEHKASIVQWVVTKDYLVTLDANGVLSMWQLSADSLGTLKSQWKSQLTESLSDGDKDLTSLTFNSLGDRLALARSTGGGLILSINPSNTELERSLLKYDEKLLAGSYHPHKRILATATPSNKVVLWNTKTLEPLTCLSMESPCQSLLFSSRGDFLIQALQSGIIRSSYFTDEEWEAYLKNVNLPQALYLKLALAKHAVPEQQGRVQENQVDNDNYAVVNETIPDDCLETEDMQRVIQSFDGNFLRLLQLSSTIRGSVTEVVTKEKPEGAVAGDDKITRHPKGGGFKKLKEQAMQQKAVGKSLTEDDKITRHPKGGGFKKLKEQAMQQKAVGKSFFEKFAEKEQSCKSANSTVLKPVTKFELDEKLALLTSARAIPNRNYEIGMKFCAGLNNGDRNLNLAASYYWHFTVEGHWLLHYAAQRGNVAATQAIFNHIERHKKTGFSVDAQDKKGWTPLHMASAEGHLEEVECLVKHGAKVDLVTNLKSTPLHVASSYGHLPLVDHLLSQPDGKSLINMQDANGWTALHCAAYHGHKEIVALLKGKGVDIRVRDNNGCLAFNLATNVEIKALLTILSPEKQKKYLRALVAATTHGQIDSIRRLLEAGVDINGRFNGKTVLHITVGAPYAQGHEIGVIGYEVGVLGPKISGNLLCMKYLVEHGADVNAKDGNGKTPYELAVEKGQDDVAEYLKGLE